MWIFYPGDHKIHLINRNDDPRDSRRKDCYGFQPARCSGATHPNCCAPHAPRCATRWPCCGLRCAGGRTAPAVPAAPAASLSHSAGHPSNMDNLERIPTGLWLSLLDHPLLIADPSLISKQPPLKCLLFAQHARSSLYRRLWRSSLQHWNLIIVLGLGLIEAVAYMAKLKRGAKPISAKGHPVS